jgi:hypothetical protein
MDFLGGGATFTRGHQVSLYPSFHFILSKIRLPLKSSMDNGLIQGLIIYYCIADT